MNDLEKQLTISWVRSCYRKGLVHGSLIGLLIGMGIMNMIWNWWHW